MKSFLLVVLLSISSTILIFSQELPHKMTAEEESVWKNYNPPLNPLFTYPPAGPVRTMAEWEELQGIMITWTSYTSILRQIVDYAQEEGLVYIVCSDSNSVKSYLTQGGVPLVNLKFLLTGFNSIWCRDYGPWTVYRDDIDSMKIIDWIYNRPRPLDDDIPVFFANYINVPIHQTTQAPYDLIATGGNFMTDGHGTGFSSRLILNENPGKTEAEIDTIMSLYMGLDRYIKMNTLPYDEIHHIDMHMKLLDEETLLVGQYPQGVADGPQIEANLQYILNNFLTCYGRPFKVVRIPMPPDASGHYPNQGGDYRTYTNSIIINKTVIIPTYEEQYDTTAFRIYREAMPGYNIEGINSNSIIPLLGAIHCITKEIGVFNPLLISHASISGTVTYAGPYDIDANIRSASGIADAELLWTTDTTAGYTAVPMTEISSDSFSASIPYQTAGTEVFYYLRAAANDGRETAKPLTAPAGCYHFRVSEEVPVELISFNAESAGDSVMLKWSTASELNCRGYEIERKAEGIGFAVIGFIKGAGTSTGVCSYLFTDRVSGTGEFTYRLKQFDYDGSERIIAVTNLKAGLYDYVLEQNYPNPFNPATTIGYSVPGSKDQVSKASKLVTLKIYNTLGQEVMTLVNGYKTPGSYTAVVNAGNLSSGIYFYRMTAGSFSQVKKMVLIR